MSRLSVASCAPILTGRLADGVKRSLEQPLSQEALFRFAAGNLATAPLVVLRESLHVLRRFLVGNTCTRVEKRPRLKIIYHLFWVDLAPQEAPLGVWELQSNWPRPASGRGTESNGGNGRTAMKINSLEDLFLLELRDMYDSEKRLVKALPKMAKAASSQGLRSAFEEHLEQTKQHVSRLETIFQQMNQQAKTKKCEAMIGIIEEEEELIEADGEANAKDAALIAGGQKAEHYEIASYGCLVTWAQQMGHNQCADLLQQTLSEEKAADQKLTGLAQNLNAAAQMAT
jgi:ferritin-like metal-binding protein YciE